MNREKKLSKMQVAQYLKEALQIFCDPQKDLRPALAEPFRQKDCVMASDGHVLICIKAKEAGCAISLFPKMEQFDAHKPIPAVGFEDLLAAKTVRRIDIERTIGRMKKYEEKHSRMTMADLCGVKLTMEALSHIEKAMAVCGAWLARLVWHQDDMVVLQLDNGERRDAVTILHMGMLGLEGTEHILPLPSWEGCEDADVSIDWQKGLADWKEIRAKMEREAEEERMARRDVYMVEVIKRGFIPVYAKNPDEARKLCDLHFFDPEDDGDDMWMLGDTVPEAENAEDVDECYVHCITSKGVVDFDEIFEMEQVSEEWHKKNEHRSPSDVQEDEQ